MYEYKCVIETCGHSWTIKEGDMSCSYLSCPKCGLGRGIFLRQIKDSDVHEDIKRIAVRKSDENYMPPQPKVEDANVVDEKPKTPEKKQTERRNIEEIKVKVNTSESQHEEQEENIFDRIKKKRQQEEELLNSKTDEEKDVDVLEITGNSIEEVEQKIREFEEYYYIKVLDRKFHEQGKRIHCIIKYCRR